MAWINIIVLFVGGVLAASGFIIAKKPDAKQHIDKLVPFQGAIGVALLVLGVINILQGALTGSLRLLEYSLLWGLVGLAFLACQIGIGFLLGFGLIAKWMPGEGGAEKKGAELQQKLMKIQAPLGLVAIGLSILMLVQTLRY